jgi:hypothetical protein
MLSRLSAKPSRQRQPAVQPGALNDLESLRVGNRNQGYLTT